VNQSLSKVYFPNLNAIRFIAALMVIFHHIENDKKRFAMLNMADEPTFYKLGALGVVLFFVLSGFLITYLLLTENKVTNTISIKSFYMRRILKIWPLYLLITAIGFFVVPHFAFINAPHLEVVTSSNFGFKLLLFVTMLPNIALAIFSPIPIISHLWSIGVEEQFYLFWPILMKKINNKWLMIFGFIIAYYILIHYLPYRLGNNNPTKIFFKWAKKSPFDCMAIGGLFSLLIFSTNDKVVRLKSILFKKWLQWVVLIFTVYAIISGLEMQLMTNKVYSVLFGLIICNFAANPNRIFSLEFGWLSYLGKISYGIYIYHPIAIISVLRLCAAYNITSNLIIYPTVVAFTIGIAALSFKYFENYFIHLKHKFTKVISGNDALTPVSK